MSLLPDQTTILETIASHGNSLEFTQLSKILGLKKSRDIRALTRQLMDLESGGHIETEDNAISIPSPSQEITLNGIIQGKGDGTGVFLAEDDSIEISLAENTMASLIHGDKVWANIITQGSKHPPKITELGFNKRNNKKIIGKLHIEDCYFVVPTDSCIQHHFLVDDIETTKAHDGELVIIDIVDFPEPGIKPTAVIVEALGIYDDPGEGVESAIKKFELPFEWPEAVAQEASSLEDTISETMIASRFDARNLPFVTIDDATASDFDDAIYCAREWPYWRLMVAVADVSHYVPAGCAIDKEAQKRGTSVYFPGRVIPMLPVNLYKGLCSLDPGSDRLSLICDMKLDHEGHIVDYTFRKAVIRSHARLTYADVAKIIVDKDEPLRKTHQAITAELDILYLFYQILKAGKQQRYALDLDNDEKTFVLDEQTNLSAITREVRTDAHRIIEECMITANICAANFMEASDRGKLFRVHAQPDLEQEQELIRFLVAMGYETTEKLTPKDLQENLKSINAKHNNQLVTNNFLRYLPKAEYSSFNQGHFGLSLSHYTHFTSPIRRYPDLLVHRIISSIIDRQSEDRPLYSSGQLFELCQETNDARDRAKKAAWDVQKWLICKLAKQYKNKSLTGIITSVAEFGLFIEIDDLLIEGLLPASKLGNEFFEYQPDNLQLKGSESGKAYRLGESVSVKITSVFPAERKINFVLDKPNSSQAGKTGAENNNLPQDAEKPSKSKAKKKNKKYRLEFIVG